MTSKRNGLSSSPVILGLEICHCLCFLNSIMSPQQISHGSNNYFRHQCFHDNRYLIPDLPDDLPINRNIGQCPRYRSKRACGIKEEVKKNEWEDYNMVAYEFYLVDDVEEFHSLGILPERRKDPLRITQESIMKWGRLVVGDSVEVNKIYFIQIEV